MRPPVLRSATVKLCFFLYGALAHLLMFRVYVARAFASPTSREIADHPLTNLATALLGGLFVFLFMSGPLVRAALRDPLRIPSLFLKAAGLAALATFVALQVFFALIALYGALTYYDASVAPGPGHMSLWDMLLLMFIEIETFGGEMMFLGLSAAVGYGILCGALLIGLRARIAGSSVRIS